MKMKKYFLKFSVFVLIINSAAFAKEPEVIFNSFPQKASIYTEGYCVFEEQLPQEFNKRSAIRLPAETEINTVEISRGGKRIPHITVAPFEVNYADSISKESGKDSSKLIYYFVSINEEDGQQNNDQLTLKYTVNGVYWRPAAKVELSTADDGVNLCLDAVITNSIVSLDAVDVKLFATPKRQEAAAEDKKQNRYNQDEPIEEYSVWQDVHFSKSLYAEYPIGIIALPKVTEGTKLANIFCKSADKAETRYIWKTKERKAKKIIYVKNPHSAPLCNTRMTVKQNNVIVKTMDSEWAEPSEPVLLLEVDEDAVECASSVEVTEDFEKRNRWENCRRSGNGQQCDSKNALFYNHQYEFTCQNNTDADIKIEIVFDKKYGHEYKNIYNFAKEPTKSPGAWHVWEIELGPQEKESIKFNIDSDRKSYNEYKMYGKAVEGC